MSPVSERKQRVIDYCCSILEILEGKTHVNAEKYRKLWESMTDKEFTSMMTRIRDTPNKQICYFEVVEFERDVDLEKIQSAADWMNVPLYELVAIPDLTGDPENVTVTPYPVPVGYAHYKRMPQTVLKKNSLNLNVSKKNPITGQITNQEKTARNTDVETYAFASLGAKYALREMHGPRGADSVMEGEMMQQIADSGTVNLESLTNDVRNKTALNSLNAHFMMQMLCTNLVGPLGIIPGPEESVK